MIYEKRLTIPRNTTETDPVTADLDIHPGVVQRVSVFFPPGCAGLAHVQIKYWERVLWPSNTDGDFIGDGFAVDFPEDLEIVDPPYMFQVVGWNEDDTFPHTPIVRVQILPFDQTLRSVFERLALGPSGPVTPEGG